MKPTLLWKESKGDIFFFGGGGGGGGCLLISADIFLGMTDIPDI